MLGNNFQLLTKRNIYIVFYLVRGGVLLNILDMLFNSNKSLTEDILS